MEQTDLQLIPKTTGTRSLLEVHEVHNVHYEESDAEVSGTERVATGHSIL